MMMKFRQAHKRLRLTDHIDFGLQTSSSGRRRKGEAGLGPLRWIIQSEIPSVGGGEQRPRPIGIRVVDDDLDGTEAVERQPVRVTKRLTPLDGLDALSGKERPHLLRVDLA